MRCDLCGEDFGFVETRVREPGEADLVNGYGGVVGRIVSTRDEATVICVACITTQEAEQAERAAGLTT